MNKFKDFDAFFAETENTGPSFVFRGETHHLPATLPVRTLLLLKRTQGMDRNEMVSDDHLMELFVSLYGQDRTEQWLSTGLTSAQMIEMLSFAMEAYGLAGGDSEAPLEPAKKVQRGKAKKAQ